MITRVLCTLLFFGASAVPASAGDGALLKFMESLPKSGSDLRIAAAPTTATLGAPFDVVVELENPGYLAVLVISQAGDATFVAASQQSPAGRASLWALLDIPVPAVRQPAGYTTIVVLHDSKRPWLADERESRIVDIPRDRADAGVLLERLARRAAQARVAAHTFLAEPARTRSLETRRPERPIWILGTQGFQDEP